MANTLNTGLIPVAPATYKEYDRINDSSIGKYISLTGPKLFYNPGIGLSLSAPQTGATTNTLTLINNTNNDYGNPLLTSPSNGDTAYFFYLNTTSPTGDSIPGFVNLPFTINNASGSGLINLSSVKSQGNIRILNVLQSASYTFSFIATGQVAMSTSAAFNFDFGFFININGVETLLMPQIASVKSVYVGGTAKNVGTYIFNFPTFTQTFQLNAGDWVQLYGKGIAANPSTSVGVTLTTTTLTITQAITKVPVQTTFTNNLNISDFNVSSINFYGGSRDTLTLIGNTLTS